MTTATAPPLRIGPDKKWASLQLRELWENRELLYFLTWRDVKVRYKQTALGAAWAILQPLLAMVIFTLFFGRLARIPSDGVPYKLFAYSGLVPWMFFASGLNQSSNSLVGSANLITKVYFPRLVIPIATVMAGLVDLGLAGIVLGVMMALDHVSLRSTILLLPLFVGLALVTSVATGLWLSALNVRYRDIRYVVPFLTQFWLFATPIAYPSSLLPMPWRALYGLNPMAGVVEGFRWALFGARVAAGPMIWVSVGAAIVALIAGAVYFRQMEKTFADIV
ncbi:MAG TPA: ABC transporter permease [Bryobacteraceae bacterium]|nr:ABC transporter permease [Bryobacteraceae bacterium]